MEEKAESNINAVPTPRKEKLSLDEQIDTVENLSIETQQELKQIASEVNSSTPTVSRQLNNVIAELLKSGIVKQDGEEEHIICYGNKKEIAELLKEESIEFKQSDKVSILKNICMDKIPQKTKERFGERVYVNIGISEKYSARKIHFYLHRKLDAETYYDFENGNMVFKENRLINTELPTDDITDQLIKRGYYIKK